MTKLSKLHEQAANQEIDNLKAQIAKLQADNRSLVEQMNAMAQIKAQINTN